MSITRQLFRDVFRMLEEPLTRPGHPYHFGGQWNPGRYPLISLNRPAIDVKEEKDKYIVEAEVPGVKKDNLEVRVGEDGRSITIEGKIAESESGEAAGAEGSASTAATAQDETGNEISSERTFVGNATFRRTVWLPRPVDSKNVIAKLDHGILKLMIDKAEDKGSTVVPIH